MELKTSEGWLNTPDGHRLYTKTWIPSGDVRARLIFIHGFADHCNCYSVLFSELAHRGIKVYAYDQRGWGRSVHKRSQRGLTGSTDQVLQDMTTFISSLPADETHTPLFLMGHSMGGGQVLVYAANGPREITCKIQGFLLESPLIDMSDATKPWEITVALGTIGSKVLPNLQFASNLDPELLCRDPKVRQEWIDDSLCHEQGTLRGLAGMLGRSRDLQSGKIHIPDGIGKNNATRIWIGHGTADGVVSYEACLQCFRRLDVADKEFRAYEGWYHKLHSEPGNDKCRFAADVSRWILQRSRHQIGSLDLVESSKL